MKPAPDRVWGPKIAEMMQSLCVEIAKETGATGIRVSAEYMFRLGKGDLKMKTFTTPDAKTERMLDPNVPMPRGSKLQHDAMAAILRQHFSATIAVESDTTKRQKLFEHRAKVLLTDSSKLSPEQKANEWAKIFPLLQPPPAR